MPFLAPLPNTTACSSAQQHLIDAEKVAVRCEKTRWENAMKVPLQSWVEEFEAVDGASAVEADSGAHAALRDMYLQCASKRLARLTAVIDAERDLAKERIAQLKHSMQLQMEASCATQRLEPAEVRIKELESEILVQEAVDVFHASEEQLETQRQLQLQMEQDIYDQLEVYLEGEGPEPQRSAPDPRPLRHSRDWYRQAMRMLFEKNCDKLLEAFWQARLSEVGAQRGAQKLVEREAQLEAAQARVRQLEHSVEVLRADLDVSERHVADVVQHASATPQLHIRPAEAKLAAELYEGVRASPNFGFKAAFVAFSPALLLGVIHAQAACRGYIVRQRLCDGLYPARKGRKGGYVRCGSAPSKRSARVESVQRMPDGMDGLHKLREAFVLGHREISLDLDPNISAAIAWRQQQQGAQHPQNSEERQQQREEQPEQQRHNSERQQQQEEQPEQQWHNSERQQQQEEQPEQQRHNSERQQQQEPQYEQQQPPKQQPQQHQHLPHQHQQQQQQQHQHQHQHLQQQLQQQQLQLTEEAHQGVRVRHSRNAIRTYSAGRPAVVVKLLKGHSHPPLDAPFSVPQNPPLPESVPDCLPSLSSLGPDSSTDEPQRSEGYEEHPDVSVMQSAPFSVDKGLARALSTPVFENPEANPKRQQHQQLTRFSSSTQGSASPYDISNTSAALQRPAMSGPTHSQRAAMFQLQQQQQQQQQVHRSRPRQLSVSAVHGPFLMA